MKRRLLAYLAALFLALGASAQERKYAIMSVVGDALLIVYQEDATGSRLDRNERETVPLSTPALDNAMVLALEDAVRAHDRGAKTVLLAARDPELYKLQSGALEAGSDTSALISRLRSIAQNAGATHLLVAVKHRDQARIRLREGSVGSGWLEGFGFYVDRTKGVINLESRESSQGFIAPFTYYRLSLIDLASGKVAGERLVRESHAAANQQAMHAWDGLTAEQKVRMLESLIRREARRAVPALLAP